MKSYFADQAWAAANARIRARSAASPAHAASNTLCSSSHGARAAHGGGDALVLRKPRGHRREAGRRVLERLHGQAARAAIGRPRERIEDEADVGGHQIRRRHARAVAVRARGRCRAPACRRRVAGARRRGRCRRSGRRVGAARDHAGGPSSIAARVPSSTARGRGRSRSSSGSGPGTYPSRCAPWPRKCTLAGSTP